MKTSALVFLLALLVMTASATAQVAYVLRAPTPVVPSIPTIPLTPTGTPLPGIPGHPMPPLVTVPPLSPFPPHVVTPGPGLLVTEGYYLPSAQYPTGANSVSPHVPTLGLPYFFSGAVAQSIAGQGGHAIDQQTNRMISSDGLRIWEEGHPGYSGSYTPPAPVAAPGITTANSPIMGLSVDSTNGVLWMCDTNGFQAFDSTWPYAGVGGSVTPGFPHSQFTGIAYDPATGTLWLSDLQGCVYHCTVTGGAIGAQPVSCLPASLKGIAVNTTKGAGAIPPPACSTQIGGFRVITTDGNSLFDALSGVNYPLGISGEAYGIAYSSDGQYSFGGSTWVGSGLVPSISTPGPTINTASLPCNLDGARPGGGAFLLYGTCPLSAPMVCGSGALRVFDGYFQTTINASGSAQWTLPLGALPAGAQFTLQWVFGDWTQPCFWVFSDALTVTVGLP